MEKLEDFGNRLFEHIKHGSDDHKKWLKDAIDEFTKQGLFVIGQCRDCKHWENGEQDSAMVSTCGLRIGTWKRDDGCLRLWEPRGNK